MTGQAEGQLIPPPSSAMVTDRSADQPAPGVALCLSGGGFRAMLFHLGALWRLNDAGRLRGIDMVSSVSGGSITAGQLAVAWPDLVFDAQGVATNFGDRVVAPLLAMASRTIDVRAVLIGLVGWPFGVRAANVVAGSYRRHLFGGRTLGDLPPKPDFVFNATSLQTGALWRLRRDYAWDYRLGKLANHAALPLSDAVAASSAFPPVLSPFILRPGKNGVVPGSGDDPSIFRPPYTTAIRMTDGGVYDNLGLEPAWKHFTTILVSDGGGQMQPSGRPAGDWLLQTRRVLEVIDNQVRDLRKRQVVGSYGGVRDGAYWGIRSDIANYHTAGLLPCPHERTMLLADIGTRLAKLDELSRQRLVNWGYAICDAGMRTWVDRAIPAAQGFPYPGAAV